MQRYILEADDTLRLLRGENGEAEMIELWSGTRMLFFALSSVENVRLCRLTPVGADRQDALSFTADDPLLGRRFALFVPKSHKDYGGFSKELTQALRLTDLPEEEFVPHTCNQSGHHG